MKQFDMKLEMKIMALKLIPQQKAKKYQICFPQMSASSTMQVFMVIIPEGDNRKINLVSQHLNMLTSHFA